MSNPYQSPVFNPKEFQDSPSFSDPVPTGWGWVHQVRIVAILNAVQGGLEIAIGLMMGGFGIFFLVIGLSSDEANPFRHQPNGPPPWWLGAFYVGVAVPLLLTGALRILSGVQNFRYRGRILGLTSMVLGTVSALTCYCAPTSIGILIYGLIIYLHPAVNSAFLMGQQGRSASEILAAFMPYRPMPYQPTTIPPGNGSRLGD